MLIWGLHSSHAALHTTKIKYKNISLHSSLWVNDIYLHLIKLSTKQFGLHHMDCFTVFCVGMRQLWGRGGGHVSTEHMHLPKLYMQQTAIIFQLTNLSTLKVHKRGTWLIWMVTYLQTIQHYTYYHFAILILSFKNECNFLCKSYMVDVFITTITYDMTAPNQLLVEQNPKWCQPTITVTGTSINALSATCLTDTSGGHNGTPDGT